MVWHEKIKEVLESDESLEMKIYRNSVREKLQRELTKKREAMLKQNKYPFGGEWLTIDEIILTREKVKKENFTRLILLILIFFLLFVTSLILGFFVWQQAS